MPEPISDAAEDHRPIPGIAEAVIAAWAKHGNPFAPIRFYLRTYFGTDGHWLSWDEDTTFLDLMQVEFGLVRDEVEGLTATMIGALLTRLHRLRTAPTDDARNRVLAGIQDDREKILSRADPPPMARIVLKALEKFPPPARAEQGPEQRRLTLDPASWTITFDDEEFEIKNPRAFKIFHVIAERDGNIVTSETIKRLVPGVGPETRIGQLLDVHLPETLRKLIRGQRGQGSGFSLKLPKKRLRNDVQRRAMKR